MPRRPLCIAAVLGIACTLTAGPDVRAADAPACPVEARISPPPANLPLYRLVVRPNSRLTDITGSLSVTFAPSVATDRLVFRLWPNAHAFGGGARLTVGAVRSAARTLATSRPDTTTLVVRRPLAADERVTVSMRWRLRLSRRAGLALRGGRPARLVSFFPLLAWDGARWATDPPLRHLDSVWPTSPVADFDVRVPRPQGLQVLATGAEVGPGHWRARAVRDFALAIGSFRVARIVVRAPDPIAVVVGIERRSLTPIAPFVDETRRALRHYAQRYGGYPWQTYTLVVSSDFAGLAGFAYSTIGFVGDSSAVLVAHETAHQWFQSLVGNNQSRDPWISEGLATWAQGGLERSLASLVRTVIPAEVRGRLGERVGFFDQLGFENLRLGVYVQTVQALADLGDPQGVDCAIRAFVVRNAYRVASPADVLDALDDVFPDAEAKLRARGARF